MSAQQLLDLGFQPLELQTEGAAFVLPDGEQAIRRRVVGDVPDSPGLYAFTTSDKTGCISFTSA